MRYIDKTKKTSQGHAITESFLRTMYNRYRNSAEGFCPERVDLYKQFGKEIDDEHGGRTFRLRMADEVLIPEQEGRCCYCLRRLDKCLKPNMEHVVPNHPKDDEEWREYMGRTPIVRDNCCRSDEWLQNPETCVPNPHSIAYENLVMSCDGDLLNSGNRPVSCNLRRRHNDMLPLVLMGNISQILLYRTDGTAFWKDENDQLGEVSISHLGLNTFMLRLVRRVWFVVNDNNLILDGTTNREEFINTIFGLMSQDGLSEEEKHAVFNFKLENMWQLLLQFDAFRTISHV